jgi:hypothetical protein
MDFTVSQYKNLLQAIQSQGYTFQTYEAFVKSPAKRPIVLRHDVDALPENSLRFARIQASMGIVGTYYFRIIPQSFNKRIIREIVDLGHEIGYHYETMDTCKGKVDKAYEEFCSNLEKFNKIVSVKTISMHGSPLSGFDNREIWKKYDYHKLGIIAEPYFNLNFNEVYYITDTGRRWDGHLYNIRDKATKENPLTNPQFLKLRFHNTTDLIHSFQQGNFPQKAMLNFHPQRWHDRTLPWMKELLWQNTKNQLKRMLVAVRKN